MGTGMYSYVSGDLDLVLTGVLVEVASNIAQETLCILTCIKLSVQ